MFENFVSNETQGCDPAASVEDPALDIEKLFKENYNQLVWFVQRHVRDAEDAKDVVQNTFVEGIRCARHFSGRSKPSTWLFGIALNLARNHVRRNCQNSGRFCDEEILAEMGDENLDPANVLEQRQIVDKVFETVSSMPDKIRNTFEAVLEGENSYEAAAAKLQVPIGTVRSRVSRVRAKIRSELLGQANRADGKAVSGAPAI